MLLLRVGLAAVKHALTVELAAVELVVVTARLVAGELDALTARLAAVELVA